MKKLSIAATVICILLLSGCSKSSSSTTNIAPTTMYYTIEPDIQIQNELNADSITNVSIPDIDIKSFVNKDDIYESAHRDIVELFNSQILDYKDDPFKEMYYSCIDKGGFYLSAIPYCQYDAVSKQVNNYACYFLFTSDKEFLGYIFLEKADSINTTLGFGDAVYEYLLDKWKENPSEKSVSFSNGENLFLLNKDNSYTVYQPYNSLTKPSFEIKGDVYSKLVDSIGISYDELMSPDNMLWFDLIK